MASKYIHGFTWFCDFFACLMFICWKVVPRVVPKSIKSKSVMFGDSKNVLKMFLGRVIHFPSPFQIWKYIKWKKSNFRILSPKFQNWVPLWVPSNKFLESITKNLFQNKNVTNNSPSSLLYFRFCIFLKFSNIDT